MHNNFADCSVKPFFERAEATNAAAEVTIAADSRQFWVIDWIGFSYSDSPTGGKLTVTIGGETFYEVDIKAAGQDFIAFDRPLYNPDETKGEELKVTLSAGGASIVGKVNVRGR